MIKKLLLAFCMAYSVQTFAILSPVVDSIPMSDGKKLAADVYIPAGMSNGPVILIQTPYNRLNYRGGLPLQIGLNLDSSHYIFVVVDWRGFYGSAAAAIPNPNYGSDGHDCVEWIAQQTWSSGKVGTWGPSALGRVQFQTAQTNPPHLTCICPLVSGSQYTYQQYYPNGDLRTEYVEQLNTLGFGISSGVMSNQLYSNVWQYTENANFYPDSVLVPCYMIDGWYDMNIEDVLTLFGALQTSSPANVQQQHRLLMGPWTHGGHGTSVVGAPNQGQLTFNEAAYWSDSLALLFFDYHLRSLSNNWDQSPPVQYFQMGENTWHNSPSWPPTGPLDTNFYFHANGALSTALPGNATDSVNYNYDPTNPSPTYGGPTLRPDLAQGPYNEADTIENRNDIAIFTTDTLTANLVMRGNAVVHLKVASNRPDTDFDIRLTDVYPDGRSMIVNDGCYRMRCLNGFAAADTAPIVPGQIYNVAITLPASCNTFLPGHRLRVDVTSSNYPRFNRNMNNDGVQYPNKSMDTLVNPLVASNIIYTNSINLSYITLPLVDFTTGINNISGVLNDVRVYPNPANNQLHVNFANSVTGFVTLCDMLGNKLAVQPIEGLDNTIPLTNLSAGVYLLQIQTDKGMGVRKVVVER